MKDQLWFCVGGPLHGKWRPAGLEMCVPVKLTTTAVYASVFGVKSSVVIPNAQIVYLPTAMRIPGWVVPLPCWAESRIAEGLAAVTFAALLPGGLHHVPRDMAPVCRWCFGRPLEGQETCSRTRCISDWAAVRSLDTITWRGEDR